MAFDLSKAGFGKESVSNLDKIQMIPLNQIHGNRQNFYSIDGISELADSIRMVGLLNPVSVVKCDDSYYRLVSGHRRFEAYRTLREDEWFDGHSSTDFDKIPAIVLKDMDDLSETLALITANSTARELTYREKLQQEKILRETLTAMKAAGKDVPKNLGQYIADQIGVSRNEVSRMHSVNENLIPEAREKVDAGEMTAQQAYELSRKPEGEQRQSTYVQEAVAEYQREAESLRGDLKRFVSIYADSLAYSATRGIEDSRYESISALGKAFRNRGGTVADGLHYTSAPKGVFVHDLKSKRPDRPFSWTEVWDVLAMYAIRALAEAEDNDDDDVYSASSSSSAWRAGTPDKDGAYAVVVKFTPQAIKTSRRVMWWHGGWCTSDNKATMIEDDIGVSVLGWIPLPEDDPEV